MTTGYIPEPASPVSVESLRQMVDAELSMKARVWHICLLLASMFMTIGIVSLWTTEPYLPARTHAAFGVMTCIGLAWSAFALRVLTGRRILFVRHRIVAGRMAVTFTSMFVIGAFAIGVFTGGRAGYLAAAFGVLLLTAAVLLLRRAQRAFALLTEQRQSLERRTGRTA